MDGSLFTVWGRLPGRRRRRPLGAYPSGHLARTLGRERFARDRGATDLLIRAPDGRLTHRWTGRWWMRPGEAYRRPHPRRRP